MSETKITSDDASILQSGRLTRRTFLVVSSVSVSGCSALGRSGAKAYQPGDQELRISAECATADAADVIATLSWEWDGEDGGSAPEDALVISWPDEKWELVTAAHSTTDTVQFDGKGVRDGQEGVRFRHDDKAADGGVRYAASCKITPTGDFEKGTRNIIGQFAHVRQDSDGNTPDEQGSGWFKDIDEEWMTEKHTDYRAVSCEQGDS